MLDFVASKFVSTPTPFTVEAAFKLHFFTQVFRAVPRLPAGILRSTHEWLQMLRVTLVRRTAAFPRAAQAAIGRVDFSLQCCPPWAPQTPARFSTECGPCFLGLLREASQPVPCAAAAPCPHRWASARMIAHYLLRHRLAHRASLQAGNNRACNISWPLCKIKSLFLCEGKYSSSFQKLQI